MLGNFSYYNPTKLYFGDESLNFLKDELKGSLSGNTLSHSCVKSNSCSMLLLVVCLLLVQPASIPLSSIAANNTFIYYDS